jgi:hypothetical protein
VSDIPQIRIEHRPAASNASVSVGGITGVFWTGSVTGLFLEPPPEEATPTIGDVYNQLVAYRAESQVNHVSLSHGIDRIIDATSAPPTQLDETRQSRSEPSQKLVSLKGVTRSVSVYVMVLCLLSLALWALEGFVLINPAASLVILLGSIMAFILSFFIDTPPR